MTHSLRLSTLSGITCLALAIVAGPGCGGSEPPPHAPPIAAGEHRGGASGGCTEEKVDKTFQRALSDFQRCLDDGAKRVEFLGGSVAFFLKIDAEGKVD